MTRQHLTFDCAGSLLLGSLDKGEQTAGLLLVTGGNEIRSGAFSGQADFATQIASNGFCVFRFDRRGIGDSEGANEEFQSSAEDIAAALSAFRQHCPHLTRIIGFGNCDAASALMLAKGAGLDGLVLSNPWTFEDQGDDEAPPEVVRDHYRNRLSDPAAIRRLLTGKVSIRKLLGSLVSALKPAPAPSSLVQDMAAGLDGYAGSVRILVADRDRTGKAFLASWKKTDPRIRICADATHAYVEPGARQWLEKQVLQALSEHAS